MLRSIARCYGGLFYFLFCSSILIAFRQYATIPAIIPNIILAAISLLRSKSSPDAQCINITVIKATMA